ncbi:MAG: hypothetical protein ABI311_09720, partial [Gemmatimonadaceae bacterium]
EGELKAIYNEGAIHSCLWIGSEVEGSAFSGPGFPETSATKPQPLTRFLAMLRRAIRTLFSVLLIPALTGVGTSCTTMGSLAAASAGLMAGVPMASHAVDSRCDEGASGPAGSSQQPRHQTSTGANCCPVLAGCSAVALPALIAAPSPIVEIVASIQLAPVQLPIGWAVAPEPPPPKA